MNVTAWLSALDNEVEGSARTAERVTRFHPRLGTDKYFHNRMKMVIATIVLLGLQKCFMGSDRIGSSNWDGSNA
jgi:hypothetical protein